MCVQQGAQSHSTFNNISHEKSCAESPHVFSPHLREQAAELSCVAVKSAELSCVAVKSAELSCVAVNSVPKAA